MISFVDGIVTSMTFGCGLFVTDLYTTHGVNGMILRLYEVHARAYNFYKN